MKGYRQKGVVLVYFSAGWCGPCRAQAPAVENLSRVYQGQASFIQVDVDQHQAEALECMVLSIPTLIVLKNGNEICRLVGLHTQEAISKALDKAF